MNVMNAENDGSFRNILYKRFIISIIGREIY